MQWFYVKDGQSLGPVELSDIRALLVKGELTVEALVWNETMGQEWLPIKGVPDFSDAMLPDGSTVEALVGPVEAAAPKSSLRLAKKEERTKAKMSANAQQYQDDMIRAAQQTNVTQPMWGYACPHCGAKVKRAHGEGAQKWAGLVGFLVAAAMGPMFCQKCGNIPRSDFPSSTRVRMSLGSLALVLVALLLLGFVIWLYAVFDV